MSEKVDTLSERYPWALRVEKVDASEFSDGKIKRDSWGPGPWEAEPDVVEWRTDGLACLIVRNRLGALCGYVGIPEGHPFHGKAYSDVESVRDLRVHGGLTYSNACAGHICHVARPGEPDNVWWLGFDCNHSGDMAPGMMAALRACGADHLAHRQWASYRDIEYVRHEVENLAQQLS
jgi:hypothetical protein